MQRRLPKRRVAILLTLAVIAGGWGFWRWRSVTVAPQHNVDAPTPAADPRDAEFRRLLVGTWQDEYKAKRTMTVRPDGTATMVVEPSGMAAALFAPRLEFAMTWSIAGGRLQKHSTGGTPKTTVQLLLKTMGDRVDEPILELTAQRLLLLDKDGQTRYDWRRVQNTVQ